jgi:hypothetical protein
MLLALGAEAEYEQIGGEGAQNFLGPRGVKYLNTGLVIMHNGMDLVKKNY